MRVVRSISPLLPLLPILLPNLLEVNKGVLGEFAIGLKYLPTAIV
jgi:hypothetical protein